MSLINNPDLRRWLNTPIAAEVTDGLDLADIIGARNARLAQAWMAARHDEFFTWRGRDLLMRTVEGASDEEQEAHREATRQLRRAVRGWAG